jgi:hypothetical protein
MDGVICLGARMTRKIKFWSKLGVEAGDDMRSELEKIFRNKPNKQKIIT